MEHTVEEFYISFRYRIGIYMKVVWVEYLEILFKKILFSVLMSNLVVTMDCAFHFQVDVINLLTVKIQVMRMNVTW